MQIQAQPTPRIETVEAREDFRGPYLLICVSTSGPCRAGSIEHLSCWFVQRDGKIQCFQCDTIETARQMGNQ